MSVVTPAINKVVLILDLVLISEFTYSAIVRLTLINMFAFRYFPGGELKKTEQRRSLPVVLVPQEKWR